MKTELKNSKVFRGNKDCPIYNHKMIQSILKSVDKDIEEVQEEMDEAKLLNRMPCLSTVFQKSYLTTIKKHYTNLHLSVCN